MPSVDIANTARRPVLWSFGDGATYPGHAVDRRLAGFEELCGSVDQESSRGLCLALAITRLRDARNRLSSYRRDVGPSPKAG